MVIFGNEVTKTLCNLCLHFARQNGQDKKKGKENYATNGTKIPKTKIQKYGMNKTYESKHFSQTSICLLFYEVEYFD